MFFLCLFSCGKGNCKNGSPENWGTSGSLQKDHKYLWNSTKRIAEITVLNGKKIRTDFQVTLKLLKTTCAFHVERE